uniref:Major facilitator superfamily (MFS) profile domain-containing protein n=1 Tax=Brassica oleracea var. oleracea TaxID=109376 RepID=A0A0D3AUH2_BRAOL
MAYYGISSNLVIYMTTKLHQGTVKSSSNVTNWVGTIFLTPILGAYVADAHLGRYLTFVISSAICFLRKGGQTSSLLLLRSCYLSNNNKAESSSSSILLFFDQIGILRESNGRNLPLSLVFAVRTDDTEKTRMKPPECSTASAEDCEKASVLQLAVFFGALYILAIGMGGTKPNISTIGADQFDEWDSKEKIQKISFFNWWMFSIFFGTLFANTILVCVQDNVGWAWGYGLPTLGLALSISVFLLGTPFYRHKLPTGSPFLMMARVIVASFRKAKAPMPSDPTCFHEQPSLEYERKGTFPIPSTQSLRFLDRASIKTGTIGFSPLLSSFFSADSGIPFSLPSLYFYFLSLDRHRVEVGSSDVSGSENRGGDQSDTATGSERGDADESSQSPTPSRRVRTRVCFDQIDCRPTIYHPGEIFEELDPLPPGLLRDPRAQSWGNMFGSCASHHTVRDLLRASGGAGVTYIILSTEQRPWSPPAGYQCVYESYFGDHTKLWFPIPRLVTSYAFRRDIAISQLLNGSL